MRIAVTGAGGFLGAHLVRVLLADGVAVRAMIRSGAPAPGLDGLDVERVPCDLRTDASLVEGFSGCEGVIHLAAAYVEGRDREDLLSRVNVEGTRRVLTDATAAGVRRVVHCSTMGTCVVPGSDQPATEADELAPDEPSLSPYNRSKLLGERIALGADGVEVVVVNPTAPVGAWDRKPTVTGARIRDVVLGRWPRLLAGPVNHVAASACAQGMAQAFARGVSGERYLLGGEDVGPESFLNRVASAAGKRPPRRSWIMRARGKGAPAPGAFRVDASKARRALGWDPGDLDAAFAEAANWFSRRT